jgi:DNA-binding transcriptional LysR family regulator
LARLRGYFCDPLFIRVGANMQPTPKALQLRDAVRELVQISAAMHGREETFDPKSSQREFRLLLTDVGMVHFLPVILQRLEGQAAGIRLLAVAMDSRQLEAKLESGEADIALGAFPHASRGLRRQRLYCDSYVSVARKSHPRLAELRSRTGFVAERHVVISPSASGHAAHELVARALAEHVPNEKVFLRVPSFAAIAVVAMRTDAIGTLPSQLASTVADELGLVVFPVPFPVPRVEIAQYWHERYQQDAAHRWMRTLIASLFRDGGDPPRTSSVRPNSRIAA